MADLPDWVERVQIAVTVENVPIIPEPATEVAAGGVGEKTTLTETYAEVVSWEVDKGKVGELKEILIISDDYDHMEVRISIAGEFWAEEWSPTSAMPIIFEDLKLVAGTIVLVEARSSDNTAINVNAIIVGKEIGY